jgi:hypothetical protein
LEKPRKEDKLGSGGIDLTKTKRDMAFMRDYTGIEQTT